MAHRFSAIKKEYGLQKNADLIRLLVTDKFKELGLSLPMPRFEQINSDTSGVKILDRDLHKIVDVMIKPSGISCSYDERNDCEHVIFALSIPEVKALIDRKRREGWKI